MVRVSCSSLKETMSEGLVAAIGGLGLQAIETPVLVRTVYEGEDQSLGAAVVWLFSRERDHEIQVDYGRR